MIDFVDTPPFLRIALRVAMATMHFLHSPNKFIFEGTIFSHLWYPREQCGTNEKLPWVGAK